MIKLTQSIPEFWKNNNQNNNVTCLLCPHYCQLSLNAVGKCSVRKENRGKIVPLYPNLVSLMAVEPIEKKPFRHWMAGTKTLSIGGYGCSLDCSFCENHSISQTPDASFGMTVLPEKVVEIAGERQCSSICMTYSEPTVNFEYLIKLGNICLQEDIPFLLKTNAYINEEPWKCVCFSEPAMNIDWKGPSPIIEDRIREAVEYGLHVEISVPLHYSSEQINDQMMYLGKWLSGISSDIPCHLLKITPAYNHLDFIPSDDDIERAFNVLSSYVDYVYK